MGRTSPADVGERLRKFDLDLTQLLPHLGPHDVRQRGLHAGLGRTASDRGWCAPCRLAATLSLSFSWAIDLLLSFVGSGGGKRTQPPALHPPALLVTDVP